MGQGIAQWFLQQGIQVQMVDAHHEFALKAREKIIQQIESLVTKNKIAAQDAENFKKNLTVRKLEEINKDCDLVVEAIIEDKAVKTELFKKLDALLSPSTIFASNTSSFPITELARDLSDERKNKFLGLHFFNPATLMKLVEVINGLETDRKLAEELLHWFNQRGKTACLCSDSPGFIVNRIARNFYGEALRAVEVYNLEKIKEVDLVMKKVGGFKMGPFELMDLIGIDVNLSVTESVYRAFFDEHRFKPHRLQKEMVNAQRLGRKTNKGFYHYDA